MPSLSRSSRCGSELGPPFSRKKRCASAWLPKSGQSRSPPVLRTGAGAALGPEGRGVVSFAGGRKKAFGSAVFGVVEAGFVSSVGCSGTAAAVVAVVVVVALGGSESGTAAGRAAGSNTTLPGWRDRAERSMT
jgi:hypothetical protein